MELHKLWAGTAKRMKNIWTIGALAGLATVLLYVSSILAPAGGLLGMFVPLPSLIAGLAYGWPAAGIAGLVGAVLFFFLTQYSGLAGLVYAIVIAVPATLLAQAAGYWRPDGANDRFVDSFRHPPAANEVATAAWFPLSGMLMAIVVLATVLSTFMTLSLGADDVTYKANVHEMLDDLVDSKLKPFMQNELTPDQRANLKVTIAAVLPAVVSASWMLLMILNLWIAARIAQASGLMARPRADIRMTELPRGVVFGLGVALLLASFGGLLGRIGVAFSGAALFALLLIGLAVLHEWSVGRPARPILLSGVYIGVLITTFVAIVPLIVLAFADWFFGLRARARLRREAQLPPSRPPPDST